MRCPSCTERNSVAARKCEHCGERFKRKTVPVSAKLAVGGVAVALTASLIASILVPKLIDPEQNLARTAKRMTIGPKSGDDAHQIKKDFVEAVKAYLKQVGNLKAQDMTTALQRPLASTAYEIHVVDLPRGLKLVEIDTLLQANAFIVMKSNAGMKIFDLPQFEVFDDARILNDSAGPVLALLGHSGGPPPHRPVIRTYALLPDYVSDETEKLVPAFVGEGVAKFDKNGTDIKLELSLQSIAKSDNIALDTGTRDDQVHQVFRWKDAHYVQNQDLASTASGVAYEVAKSLQHPDIAHCVQLSPAITQFLKSNVQTPGKQMVLSNMGAKAGKVQYRLAAGDNKQFIISLQRANGQYTATDIQPVERTEFVRLTPTATRNGIATAPTFSTTIASSPAPIPRQVAVEAPKPATEAQIPQATRTNDPKVVVRGLIDQGSKPSTRATVGESGAAIAAVPSVATAPKAPVNAVPTETHTSSRNRERTAAYVSGAFGATLRSGGSRDAKAISNLSKGDKLELIDKQGEWYRVRYQGNEGFVFASLVSENSGSPRNRDKRERQPAVSISQSIPTQNSSEKRSSRRKRHNRENRENNDGRESKKLAQSMPEPATGKRRGDDKGKNTSRSRSSSHRVKMATIEPLLVP